MPAATTDAPPASSPPSAAPPPWIGPTAGVVAAVCLAAGLLLLPPPGGLPPAGWRALAIFATCLLLWVTEAIPVAVTALLAVVLQPVFGVATPGAAFTAFMSPVFFFVLAMFVLARAFVTTGLATRFAYWLLAKSHGATRRVLVLTMIGTGLASTVISDVPVTAVFMAIALGIIRRLGLVPGASNFARGLMMGIPIAALIGGVGTPAGASTNVLGLFLLERHAQVRVTFVEWAAIGLPMVAVLVPFAAWVLLRTYPPEIPVVEGVDFRAELAALGRLTAAERRLLAIGAAMLTAWIASSWYPAFDTAVVAVLGAVVMFLPGMRLFSSWKDVEQSTAWDALLVIGGVTSLGAASAASDLAAWIVQASVGGLGAWPATAVIGAVSLFIVLIHLLVPVNPAIVAAMVPPVTALAAATGQAPALYAVPVIFTASCSFLLPLDAVPLVTYGHGYYRMFDMLRPGAVISLAWEVVMTALMAAIGPLFGWI
jgi:sodium-dependent dicarboxylate transporter 2/3/5